MTCSPTSTTRCRCPTRCGFVGPLLFQVGTLALLTILASVRPRRLPAWSPVLVLAGFLMFAVNLDLIPVGALLVLAGLSPVAREPQAREPQAREPRARKPQAGTDRKEDAERDGHPRPA